MNRIKPIIVILAFIYILVDPPQAHDWYNGWMVLKYSFLFQFDFDFIYECLFDDRVNQCYAIEIQDWDLKIKIGWFILTGLIWDILIIVLIRKVILHLYPNPENNTILDHKTNFHYFQKHLKL